MAAKGFRVPVAGPNHMSAPPTTDNPPEKALVPGLEHRPFSEEEIKQAFETFDLDKNRFVGAMEIKHILAVIGEEATDEEIDEMIRMCDNDGDGQVTFDEFSKLMKSPPPALPPPPGPVKKKASAAQQRSQMSVAAPLADASASMRPSAASVNPNDISQKTRVISVETLVKKLSGGMEKIKPSQIKKIYKRFQDIDLDKSGAIEYEEFLMALDIDDNTTSKQMFRVFDMDGSGTIELKEFIVVLSRYTSAAKSEKLKFAFMMFDEDGSGYIEKDELINMLQASFVIEGFSQNELEERANKVFEFLGLDPDDADARISYENFLKLSTAKNGLVYPLTADEKKIAKDVSINAIMGADGAEPLSP
mmetsp:Transcript_78229/g.135689  ORF Transcript_78229/g.135689 Transcript_78229/m.135689 type:complete len:362 (+) Transcript_78229:109-1194(+)